MSVENFIFSWKELSANMLFMYSHLQFVLSANLFQSFNLSLKFGITDVSGSTIIIFASTRPNGGLIATQFT